MDDTNIRTPNFGSPGSPHVGGAKIESLFSANPLTAADICARYCRELGGVGPEERRARLEGMAAALQIELSLEATQALVPHAPALAKIMDGVVLDIHDSGNATDILLAIRNGHDSLIRQFV